MKTTKNTLQKLNNLFQTEYEEYIPLPEGGYGYVPLIQRYEFVSTNDYNNVFKTLINSIILYSDGKVYSNGSSYVEGKSLAAIKAQIISDGQRKRNFRVTFDKDIEYQERTLSDFIAPFGYIEYLTDYQSDLVPEWWNMGNTKK